MRKQAQPAKANTDQPRKEVSGQLETDGIGDVERAGTRATWGMVERRSPKRMTEQSEDSKRATGWHGTPRRLGTEVSRDRRMSIWGNLDTDRRRYRGRKAKGQPGAFTTGTAEGERIEATRRSITGKAGDAERGAT